MKYLKERVAYLKGLADGMQINEGTNEGKLLKAIIDVLDDMALAVDDIEEVQEELSDQVDAIDEDLEQVEEILYEDECCDEDECLGEIECPHCNEKICITEDMFNEEGNALECPKCGEKIDVEWECDCEDCKDEDEEE